jgi:hypothetical protein
MTIPTAQAGIEGRYIEALRNHGYTCKNTPKNDGTICQSGTTYVVVPNNLTAHKHNVFYAHGLTGVCGNGASGENYLKYESPTLQRIGAIAIMPYREDAADTSFPLTSFLASTEAAMASESVPLIMAGHSAAGSFLGAVLGENPKVTARVDQALLLDAIYAKNGHPPGSAALWLKVLEMNPRIKVTLVSSTTYAMAQVWMEIVKQKFPANVYLESRKTEGHCDMPKYFSELE